MADDALRWAPIASNIYILDWQIFGRRGEEEEVLAHLQLGYYQYCLLYIIRSRLVEPTLWYAEQA